ncbi:uncharacterized protein LOC142666250 [Rhinoderma darwinii]|uniref:uncharacterized protein LOC142666250 n=1 Tax=Rhinoderma darwinii TaxID=43563 RepID=UPI003F671597
MSWGQTNPIFLLIILNGVVCGGLFDVKCSHETCQCGKTVTITCNLTHKLREIALNQGDTDYTISLQKEKWFTDDKTCSIESAGEKVQITIYKVKYSDHSKYSLTFIAEGSAGNEKRDITINVSGLCEPEISENNETREYECEAESDKKASIIWNDGDSKVYQATRTKEPEPFQKGFKLRSSLKLTEEISSSDICCYVDGGYEIRSCFPKIPETGRVIDPSNSKNPTLSVVFILLAVALIAAAVGYLVKRRKVIIIRARSLSQGPFMGQEEPEEPQENNIRPPLLRQEPV